ncbi:MAG: glycosyltransferase [Gammaproteobacteria bacterium]|nr:glycosyltransferase [Gammaproteobacteria bacterium]
MEKKDQKIQLSVLMPVRNEAVNVAIMLKIFRAVLEIEHEILIVYDYPDDDTIPVVERMQPDFPTARLIHNTLGPGPANAIRAGVEAATADIIMIFTVDDTEPVFAIPAAVSLMRQGCDLVSGTRYAHGGRRLGGSLIQKILSMIGNRAFHLLSGSVFTDATTGFKLFRKSTFYDLRLEAMSWAIVYELAIKAQLAGLRLGEVPQVSIDRLHGGASSFAVIPWLKEYARWFFWGLRQHYLLGRRGTSEVLRPDSAASA